MYPDDPCHSRYAGVRRRVIIVRAFAERITRSTNFQNQLGSGTLLH